MKFKVGDVIKDKDLRDTSSQKLRIRKIAEAGETVEGPWVDDERHRTMLRKAYILARDDGLWTFEHVTYEDEYELVSEDKSINKEELIKCCIENIERGLKASIKQRKEELECLQDTLSNLNKIL